MKPLEHTWMILQARPKNLDPYSYREAVKRIFKHTDRFLPRERSMIMVIQEDVGILNELFTDIPSPNILVHPSDMGDAVPLLVLLLEIEKKDRHANVLVLPCHQAEAEEKFFDSILGAHDILRKGCQNVLLLGMIPSSLEEEFPEGDWIVPRFPHDEIGFPVLSLIHQAEERFALDLQKQGGLYDAKTLLAPVSLLLLLFMLAKPSLARPFLTGTREREIVFSDTGNLPGAPGMDFYRDILHGNLPFVRAVPIPDCGLSLFSSVSREAGEALQYWNFLFRRFPEDMLARPRRLLH